jgi:hypothetical protein
LLGRRALGVDLVFLIEGEEEVGSGGFVEAVRKYKVIIPVGIGGLIFNSALAWCRSTSAPLTRFLLGLSLVTSLDPSLLIQLVTVIPHGLQRNYLALHMA